MPRLALGELCSDELIFGVTSRPTTGAAAAPATLLLVLLLLVLLLPPPAATEGLLGYSAAAAYGRSVLLRALVRLQAPAAACSCAPWLCSARRGP